MQNDFTTGPKTIMEISYSLTLPRGLPLTWEVESDIGSSPLYIIFILDEKETSSLKINIVPISLNLSP